MQTLCALLLVVALGCSAQTQRKIPVVVEHSGSDAVGASLAYELREGIRGSNGMKLAADTESNPRIKAFLISIEGTETLPGSMTSMAVAIAYDSNELPHHGYLLTARVQTCGTKRARECSRDILATLDSAIENLRKNHPQSYMLLR